MPLLCNLKDHNMNDNEITENDESDTTIVPQDDEVD